MEEYDYVIVGAGSAGCVVAARMSEDPDVRVLLLEAGGSDRSALCKIPGMVSIIHTVPQVKAKYDWGFYANPRPETLGRKMPYVRGKVMGGSSAINGMVWVRGNPKNYDDWAAEGCRGWGWDDVLPYFKRLESWEDGEDEFRGSGGPIQVTRAGDQSPVSGPFRESVMEACGVPFLEDYNGASQEGIGVCQVSARDGLRYSTSEAYIEPNRGRPNLEIQSRAMVHRVVIEGGRATGVEYSTKKGTVTARASREVVLCGGVIGSAQLLLLSGVGPADQLRGLDIDVTADLPVGRNLHDHLFFPLTYVAPRGGHRGTAWHFFSGMIKEKISGGTWFGRTVFESMGFVKTDPSQELPDCQIHMLPWAYPSPNQDAPVRPTVDTRPAITVWPTLIYPKSRGELRLVSADPSAAPFIDPAFLAAEEDAEWMMRGIALLREIMSTGAVAKEVTEELHPGPDFKDPDALRKELPNRVQTVYHPVGTCRMGVDERAVVDPELRVRGIEGLRVADAAIMPTVIGGNTNAACIMIGEKAADLLRGR